MSEIQPRLEGDVADIPDNQLTQILQRQLQELAVLTPPLEAYGIGGSVGIKNCDEDSDLDFFLLLPDKDFFPHIQLLRDTLPAVPYIAALPDVDFIEQFGFRLSFLLPNKISLQYFVNCPQTLSADPMRLKTNILFDQTGFLTGFLKSIRDHEEHMQTQLANRLSYEYLNELLKIRKFWRRRDFLQIIYSFRVLWSVALTLKRYTLSKKVTSPHDAERNVARDFGQAQEHIIVESMAKSDPASLNRFLHKLRDEILDGFKVFGIAHAPSEQFLIFENDIISDIDKLCL